MKKLQNNFTTPEQSKRLLELGVPSDSADMCYLREYPERAFLLHNSLSMTRLIKGMGHAMPLWSVGRLIEICKICGSYELAKEIYGRTLMYLNTVDGCICEMSYEIGKGNLDFSKLEE